MDRSAYYETKSSCHGVVKEGSRLQTVASARSDAANARWAERAGLVELAGPSELAGAVGLVGQVEQVEPSELAEMAVGTEVDHQHSCEVSDVH